MCARFVNKAVVLDNIPPFFYGGMLSMTECSYTYQYVFSSPILSEILFEKRAKQNCVINLYPSLMP